MMSAVDSSTGRASHAVLALLVGGYASIFLGRQIMAVMIEPIKLEFGASDTAMGLISGLAFAGAYALMGLPAGGLADRYSRVRLLALCAALWALTTLFCGFAVSFPMLVIARMLVAITEAPVTPASLSLIADLYPARNRSLAISCFTAAPTLSAIVGLSLGAWVIDTYGWRTGFHIIATPPLLISLLLAIAVHEPVRGRFDSPLHGNAPTLGLWRSARQLLGNSHYRKLVAACSLFSFSGLAFAMWNTPFLIRSHGLSLQSAGILAGVVTGCSAALGGLFSGWLSDRLNLRSQAWLLGLPLIGTVVTLVSLLLYILWPPGIAFTLGGVEVPTAMLWCATMGFFTMWWVAPCFNLLTQMVSPRQRATAVALQTICTTLAGIGLGPILTGLLSDLLLPWSGTESLRHALLLVHLSLLIPMFLLLQLYRQQAFAPQPGLQTA
ncbi:MFS transporter [Halopseudomonas bauzanensis]|uniref:MFS transporter n=1 Tax=Halopseudomonas bauzanensis TaxID=653930 RepID=UPI003DA754EF